MAVLITPPKAQFFDDDGNPLSLGQVYTYNAGGTVTPRATYTNAGAGTPNANPVVLDASGRADIWLVGSYRIIIQDADDNVISDTDNVTAFLNTPSGSESSIASAATTDLGSAASTTVVISGTTTITSFGSSALTSNPIYFIRFTEILTLTHNGTSLILPTSANITTANGDTATVQYLGSGNWKCLSYHPISTFNKIYDSQSATVVSGVITITSTAKEVLVTVTGEGGVADSVTDIVGMVGGQTIILRTVDSTNDITYVHDNARMLLQGSINFTPATTAERLVVRANSPTVCIEDGRRTV